MVVNADGDGVPDRMSIYTIERRDERYGLQVVLDSRSVVRVPLPLGDVRVGLIGGYDVNGSGRDELFVNTGEGAYTEAVDLYVLDLASCALVRLSGPPGIELGTPTATVTAPQFCVGASAENGCGLRCSGGLLISTVFMSRYTAYVTSYAIEGDRLRVVSSVTRDLGSAEGFDGFDCGGLRLPYAHPGSPS